MKLNRATWGMIITIGIAISVFIVAYTIYIGLPTPTVVSDYGSHYVHDTVHKVSCWKSETGAIACLPDSQVNIP